jgi:hypothetical protein
MQTHPNSPVRSRNCPKHRYPIMAIRYEHGSHLSAHAGVRHWAGESAVLDQDEYLAAETESSVRTCPHASGFRIPSKERTSLNGAVGEPRVPLSAFGIFLLVADFPASATAQNRKEDPLI